MANNAFKIKKGLIVNGQGGTVVDIQGNSGQLFSITDSLTGVLLSVNDISGIPIFEVSSNDTVKMGTFGAEGLIVEGSDVILGSQATISSHAVRADRTLRVAGTTNQVTVNNGSGNDNAVNLTGNRVWTLSLPQNIHTGATPTFGGLTVNGNLGIRAAATASTTTQIPVFIADPTSTTRTIVTRTPAQLRGDIGAQASLTNPITGTGSSGQVSFFTGTTTQSGDNGLFWDNTNKRLGIGTTSPNTRVQVSTGSTGGIIRFSGLTTDNLDIGSDASGLYQEWNSDTTAKSRIRLQSRNSGAGAYTSIVIDGGTQSLQFRTNNSERMRIDSAGNVGIGTSSPTTILDVVGGFNVSDGTSTLRFVNSAGVGLIGTLTNHSLGLRTNNTERMRITSAGNVGIGTTDPLEKLDVIGNIRLGGNRLIHYRTNSNWDYYLHAVNDDFSFYDAQSTLFFKAFYNGGGTDKYISFLNALNVINNGRVGIGTTSPVFKLSVDGGIQALGAGNDSPATGNIIYIGDGTAGSVLRHTATGRAFAIDTYSSANVWTERLRILRDGNVGIGTTAPTFKLEVHTIDSSTLQNGLNISNGSNADFTVRIKTGETLVGPSTNTPLIFTNNNNTERMRIDSTGNVGIGTTSLADRLVINGNTRIQNSIFFTDERSGIARNFVNTDGVPLQGGLAYFAFNHNSAVHPLTQSEYNSFVRNSTISFRSRGVWTNGALFTLDADNYHVEFHGYLLVTTAGIYRFGTNSDDASDIYVDGQRVADHYGGHGAVTFVNIGSNEIYLEPGYHKLFTRFEEVSGGDSILIGWNGGSGTTISQIPTGNLWHDARDRTKTWNGTNYTVGNLDVGGSVLGSNFRDATGAYNVNLGSGGSEGRGLVAGYSGGAYGGIGYNVRHTTTSSTYIAPGTDTVSYLTFNGGGFSFRGAPSGTAGRTLSLSTLMSIAANGQVSLGAQASTTSHAIRADRTLQFSNGAGISVTGAGTGAQNLTANRAWTIGVDSTVVRTSGDQTICGIKTFSNLIATNPMINSAGTGDNASVMQWRYGTSDAYRLRLKQTVTSGVVRWNFSQTNNNTDFENVLVLDRGNVGIGTTSPAGLASYTFLTTNNTTTGGGLVMQQNGVNKAAVYNAGDELYYDTTSNHVFRTEGALGGTARMYISSSGNVGIGTISPVSGQGTPLTLSSPSTEFVGLTLLASACYAHTWQLYASGDGGSNKFFGIFDRTNGAYRLVTTSAGNVGIGRTNPSQKLEVVGNVQLNDNSGLTWRYTEGDSNFYNSISNCYTNCEGIRYRSGQWTSSQTILAHSFQTWTGGWVKRLNILQNGSVGIGTTTPGCTLSVGGSICSSGQIRGGSIITAGQISLSNGTAANPSIRFSNNTDMGMYRVGLSDMGFTTGGVVRFRIAGSSWICSSLPHYFNAGTVAAPGIAFGADTNTGIYRPGVDTIGVSTNGSERLRVTSTGNVGIGTTNPLNTLHVNGTTRTSFNADAIQLRMDSCNAGLFFIIEGSTCNITLVPHINGTGCFQRRFRATPNGWKSDSSLAVGGATPSATVGRFDASNDIVAFSSDKRLKTNVCKIDNSICKLVGLTGVTYNWNEEANTVAGFDTNKRYVGVFAQDVETVLPEAIQRAPFDNDGNDGSKSGCNYLTVQYEKLVPLLIEGIKELTKKVETLEETINQLNKLK
jgi:hypothetical protein